MIVQMADLSEKLVNKSGPKQHADEVSEEHSHRDRSRNPNEIGVTSVSDRRRRLIKGVAAVPAIFTY